MMFPAEAIARHRRIRRDSWPHDHYLILNKWDNDDSEDGPLLLQVEEKDGGSSYKIAPTIMHRTVRDEISVWNPSTNDLIADDWSVIRNY